MEPGQFMASQRQADMLDAVAIAVQRWPIVGRRSELEVFERALYSGRHAGLVIYGPPGVGKTMLARTVERITCDFVSCDRPIPSRRHGLSA